MFSSNRSLSSDVRSIHGDEEMSDIRLQGVDGDPIPANRCILSARSRVFRRMLYGPFAESGEALVHIGYGSDVLRRVVQFCYTDEIGRVTTTNTTISSSSTSGRDRTIHNNKYIYPIAFESKDDSDDENDDEEEEQTEKTVRSIIRTVDAARYFELRDLELKATVWATIAVNRRPSLACPTLDEATNVGLMDSAAAKAAQFVIALRPKEAMVSPPRPRRSPPYARPAGRYEHQQKHHQPFISSEFGGLLSLGPAAMERVMKDRQTKAMEIDLFSLLNRWARFGQLKEEEADGDDDDDNNDFASAVDEEDSCSNEDNDRLRFSKQQRLDCASRIAKDCIDLMKISPTKLRDVVAQTGLIPQDILSFAFEEHAILAEQNPKAFQIEPSRPRSSFKGSTMVVVQGAGSSSVNGTYYAAGTYKGAPMYFRMHRVDLYDGNDYHFDDTTTVYHDGTTDDEQPATTAVRTLVDQTPSSVRSPQRTRSRSRSRGRTRGSASSVASVQTTATATPTTPQQQTPGNNNSNSNSSSSGTSCYVILRGTDKSKSGGGLKRWFLCHPPKPQRLEYMYFSDVLRKDENRVPLETSWSCAKGRGTAPAPTVTWMY